MSNEISATKARWILGGLVFVAAAVSFLAMLRVGPAGGLADDEQIRAYRLLGTIYGPLLAQLGAQLGVRASDSQATRVPFQSFAFSAILMGACVLAAPYLLFTMSPDRRIGATLGLLDTLLPWGTTVGAGAFAWYFGKEEKKHTN